MLTMAFILALISTIIEMFFVIQFEGFRNFMLKHQKFGLFFSLALSIALGEVFGAHGLIALMGGLGSTIITYAIYETRALHLVDAYRANKDLYKAKVRYVFEVTGKTIVLLWKILTAPVRLGMWVKRKTSATMGAVKNVSNKLLPSR